MIRYNQVRDQLVHAGVAMVALLPLALFQHVLAFAWAGLLIGMVREVTELGNPVTWEKIKAAPQKWDAPLDLACWAIGGAVVGLLI